MDNLVLVIGNKAYSSWSLRPWLALKMTGAPFREVVIPLYQPETKEAILRHSPGGKVPALHDDEITVWESVAILEYLAERFPDARLWPTEPDARAAARAASAEMHAGFTALRSNMPMNVRRLLPGRGRAPGVADDITRITAVWRDCRCRFGEGGPFLFGHFTNADAMFAPVATRFRTYGVESELDDLSRAYAATLLSLPAMQEWYADAGEEPWSLAQYD